MGDLVILRSLGKGICDAAWVAIAASQWRRALVAPAFLAVLDEPDLFLESAVLDQGWLLVVGGWSARDAILESLASAGG